MRCVIDFAAAPTCDRRHPSCDNTGTEAGATTCFVAYLADRDPHVVSQKSGSQLSKCKGDEYVMTTAPNHIHTLPT